MYEKLLNLRRTHDRHLVGCPLCQYAVLIFGVGAALDTSPHGEPLTGVHIRRLRRYRAPRDARQVVCRPYRRFTANMMSQISRPSGVRRSTGVLHSTPDNWI